MPMAWAKGREQCRARPSCASEFLTDPPLASEYLYEDGRAPVSNRGNQKWWLPVLQEAQSISQRPLPPSPCQALLASCSHHSRHVCGTAQMPWWQWTWCFTLRSVPESLVAMTHPPGLGRLRSDGCTPSRGPRSHTVPCRLTGPRQESPRPPPMCLSQNFNHTESLKLWFCREELQKP